MEMIARFVTVQWLWMQDELVDSSPREYAIDGGELSGTEF
jgi:hypothetical protein